MTLDEAMRAAIAHHQAGQLAQAEQLYRAVLQAQPQHPDANHNLGALALQLNQPAAALPFLQTALSANPGHPQYWQSAAQALAGLQRWEEAAALLDQAAAQGLVLPGAAQLRAQMAAARPAPTLPDIQALLEAGHYAQALAGATRLAAQAPAEAGAWACVALAQLQLKDAAAAEQAALKAIALAPGDLLSLRALASVRLRQQQPEAAIHLARQALAAAPGNAHALMLLGSAKAMQGDLDEADALLASALQAGPLAEAHANRAIVALRRNQPEQAMAYAEQAVRSKPFLVNIWQLLVGLYQQAGRHAQVIDALEHIIAQEPGNAPALSDLGELRRQAGRLDEARSLLARAVAADPQHASAWVNYAAALHQSGDLANAIQALEKALALNPGQPTAHCNLGAMYRDSGQPGKALGCYETAIAQRPDFSVAYNNRGLALQDLGRSEDALAAIGTAIALQPGYADAFKNRADVLKSMGQMDAAVQSYKEALALQPNLAEAHNNLGNAYKDMNRRQEAVDSLQAAIVLKPDMAELHANLGHAYKQFGDFEEALAAYQRTLALNPGHGDARYGVGNVLWQLGQPGQALQSFQQMADAGPDDFFRWAAAVDSAILYFLQDDLASALAAIERAAPIDDVHTEQARPVRAYYRYMQKLLAWWQAQAASGLPQGTAVEPLYVLGDSHSLSAHGLLLNHKGRTLRGQTLLVKGVKQWHLGRPDTNQHRQQLERLWQTLPAQATVLLTLGEIDCRMDEGIFKAWQKAGGNRPIEALLLPTLDSFIARVNQLVQKGGQTVILCGVPACNMPMNRLSPSDQLQFLQMLGLFNQQLARLARQSCLGFADVFALTDAGGGQADGRWHIDQIHLRPDALQAAFNNLHCA